MQRIGKSVLILSAIGLTLALAGRQGLPLPADSDTAYKAFARALPNAKLIAVEAPKDFGMSAADGGALFWTFRYELEGVKSEVPITPDGLIVRLTKRISAYALPPAVAATLAKESKGAKITSYERQEIGATLKLVALKEPSISHLITAKQKGKTFLIAVSASGKAGSPNEITTSGEGGEADEKGEGQPITKPKGIQVPKEQQLAVDAVKKAYHGAVVVAVEEVGYEDGSGDMAVLYYEVEFPWHGRIKEGHATPDGLMLDMDRVIEPKYLPRTVRDAVTHALPGAAIQSAKSLEGHAGPKFVALDHSKTIYLFGLEKNGKASTLRIASDGSVVKVFDPKTWSRH